jgi:hydroxymethylpyrimidine pyrophosphatase-like HAD family hydrolase
MRRYHALACDYDGTLTDHDDLDDRTIEALLRVRASGRRLVLVTGRRLDDLQRVCHWLDLFDWVVAENGALLYQPSSVEWRLLGDPAPETLIESLALRGVDPLEIGVVLVATRGHYATAAIEAIAELGLENQVIFNRGEIMILPPGINKATGLAAVLAELQLAPLNVVGIGDAENDHSFLDLCGLGVAVANAVPSLQARVDIVTPVADGAGVIDVCDRLVDDDLAALAESARHDIVIGAYADGTPLRIPAHGAFALIVGPPRSGKSYCAAGLIERLVRQHYQFCVIDPEGDYEPHGHTVYLGSASHPPDVSDAVHVLEHPDSNAVVSLLSVPLPDRPQYFADLAYALHDLRRKYGRPHWIVIDEAHHVIPCTGDARVFEWLQPGGVVMLTVDPQSLLPQAVRSVTLAVVLGQASEALIASLTRIQGRPEPTWPNDDDHRPAVLAWRPGEGSVAPVELAACDGTHRRHRRKYAEADLGPVHSFYFRGPSGQVALRAHNLIAFTDALSTVDDATWLFHLQRGDYSAWLRGSMGDDDCADAIRRIEERQDLSPQRSRALVRDAILARYTLPA